MGPVQVLVVGVDDEAAGAALGTDQSARGLEVGNGADVGTGEVVDELVLSEPRRPAIRTTPAKGRHAVTLGAELHAVPGAGLQDADLGPLRQQLAGQRRGKLQRLRAPGRDQVLRPQEFVAQAPEAAADLKPAAPRPLSVADFQAGTAGRAVGILEHDDQLRGEQLLPALQFQAEALRAEVDGTAGTAVGPVGRAVRQDGNAQHGPVQRAPRGTAALAGCVFSRDHAASSRSPRPGAGTGHAPARARAGMGTVGSGA